MSKLLVSKKVVDHTLNSNGEVCKRSVILFVNISVRNTHLLNSVNLAMGKIFVSVANFVFR